jgi:hypothetical protein
MTYARDHRGVLNFICRHLILADHAGAIRFLAMRDLQRLLPDQFFCVDAFPRFGTVKWICRK